jgi:hypothetical protein
MFLKPIPVKKKSPMSEPTTAQQDTNIKLALPGLRNWDDLAHLCQQINNVELYNPITISWQFEEEGRLKYTLTIAPKECK